MNTPDDIAPAAAQTLQADLAGQVFVPADPGYDQARQAWNLAVDERPAMVAQPASAADVAAIMRFAHSGGMRVAPQGTGHGAGPLEPLDSAMLLRTSQLRSVDIDPDARIARADAGAQWQDVIVPASDYGLTGLAGSSLGVGVTGYTLGGGMGWLARRYGLAANSVTAAEVVTPDGRIVRTDAEHEPELFWAVCGGGGSVGVVTALEMQLYPVRDLYAGALFFPLERAAEVLDSWYEWTKSVPDEMTSLGRIMRFPPLPELPDQLRGRAFAIVEAAYLGDERSGSTLIAPLRKLGPQIDTFAAISAPALGGLHMDPIDPVPARGDGALLADFPSAGIDALMAVAGPGTDCSLLSIEVRHLGGALGRPASGGSALPSIDASYALYSVGIAPTPDAETTISGNAEQVRHAIAPWRASHDYYNTAETPASVSALLPPGSYQRLQRIKSSYDPGDAMISAHPVWPTAATRALAR